MKKWIDKRPRLGQIRQMQMKCREAEAYYITRRTNCKWFKKNCPSGTELRRGRDYSLIPHQSAHSDAEAQFVGSSAEKIITLSGMERPGWPMHPESASAGAIGPHQIRAWEMLPGRRDRRFWFRQQKKAAKVPKGLRRRGGDGLFRPGPALWGPEGCGLGQLR